MRGHCFVNGKEKHVKCAYVGVNGKAQYIMKPPGVIKYGGSIADLQTGRGHFASTTLGSHAIFAGGIRSAVGSYCAHADAYSDSLVRTTLDNLSVARYGLAGANAGNYALFAGGYGSKTNNKYQYATVDTYDTSLSRGTATNLSYEKYLLTGVSLGEYAIFAGGNAYGPDPDDEELMDEVGENAVDAYNSSLTLTKLAILQNPKMYLSSASTGNYALIAGGQKITSNSALATVDAYSADLTKTIAPDLSQARYLSAGCSFSNYALFGGGIGYNGSSTRTDNVDTVDVYDQSLTRTTLESFSSTKAYGAATSIGKYAIFAGDVNNNKSVDVYDSTLTRTNGPNLTDARYYLSAATVGKYALFAGGQWTVSSVEAYTISDGYTP